MNFLRKYKTGKRLLRLLVNCKGMIHLWKLIFLFLIFNLHENNFGYINQNEKLLFYNANSFIQGQSIKYRF